MKNSRQPSRTTPRIDQRGGQSRQQNGRIPWVQPPAAQARRCAAGNALAQHRHNGPSRICRQKEAGIPHRSTTAPNTSPSQQPMPQPYRAAPSTMRIRTSEMEKGPRRMALPANWSTTTMAARSPPPARYCVVFSYDFPLLPLRRSGCGAFLFDFYRLGQRVTGPLRGR